MMVNDFFCGRNFRENFLPGIAIFHAEIERDFPCQLFFYFVPDKAEQFQAQRFKIAVFAVLALDQFPPE